MAIDANGARDKPATIYDVARRAGVSAQSVSRLVKGFEGIRPETRERVEAAIAELGYRPNQAARLLRTRKSRRIGAIVHEMFESGPARLLRGAAMEARAAGYSLNIVGVDGTDEVAITEAFEAFEEERVAGILAVTLTDSVRSVVEGRVSEVPVLLDPADARTGGAPTASESGAGVAAAHLLDLGHRRVGFIGGPDAWQPSHQRRERFLADIAAGGGECVAEWTGDWTPAFGDRAGAEFDPDSGVTAVFAANDAMAIGFMHRLAARGIRVPEEISVVGFDDIPEAAFVTPALTTVRPAFEQEGRAAIDALIAEIEDRPRARIEHPAGLLIVRDSTAARR
jgi:DNA-binding LacI/PurR family transcriptional regulator